MREEDNLDIRSEEVQEILGTPPGWMVRWGTVLALIVVVIAVALSFVIRYPDSVEKEISISFTEPPKHLIAAKSGYIDKILVNNNDEVKEGQTLLVFRSTANYNHVLHLADLIQALPDETDSTLINFQPLESLDLGELQEDYFQFIEKQSEFRRRYEQYADMDDVESMERQRSTLQNSLSYYRNQRAELQDRLQQRQQERLEKERLVRENRIPYREVQKVETRMEQLRNEIQQTQEIISNKKVEISILSTQISRTERGASENRLSASDALKESFFQLQKRVEEWVQQHVIQAPVEGIVQITGDNISKQQFISRGNEVMVVVPIKNRQLLGRMELDFQGSGAVREDQEVIVRLEAYPHDKYGAVIGKVAWKSKVPDGDNAIPVQVVFPNGLMTTRGKNIEPGEELYGEANIITNDKRLIDRIVDWASTIRLTVPMALKNNPESN